MDSASVQQKLERQSCCRSCIVTVWGITSWGYVCIYVSLYEREKERERGEIILIGRQYIGLLDSMALWEWEPIYQTPWLQDPSFPLWIPALTLQSLDHISVLKHPAAKFSPESQPNSPLTHVVPQQGIFLSAPLLPLCSSELIRSALLCEYR